MDVFSYAGGSARGWLQVAVFVAIVLVRILKPEMIRSLTLFRWASTTITLSVLVPVVMTVVLSFLSPEALGIGYRGRNTVMNPAYMMLATQSGVIALSISMFCFFASLAPPIQHEIEAKSKSKTTTPSPPAKHPLD